jgi:predicted flap endonuclease-1-like 5' DNA nuclease
MITLIGQIFGCLLIAGGIGVVVGWLLRNLSASQLTQQFTDVTATLRVKEQMLEKARYELNVQTAAMQLLESKMIESEELSQSTQQELAARNDRLVALQEELSLRSQKLTALEAEDASTRRRASESDSVAAAAQAEEVQQLHLTSQAVQQTLASNEQERHNLQRRIVELETGVSEADLLRARLKELEPAQGRVHWLEVQLSDREAEHRAALHRLDSQLAERDRRINTLEHFQQQLKKQEASLTEWETKYASALTQHEAQIVTLQNQLATHDTLQARLRLDEQLLHERDAQIHALQRHVQELEKQQQLTSQVKLAEEKQEAQTRLRKHPAKVQATAQTKADKEAVAPRQTSQNGSQLSLQIEQTKAAKNAQKDDLSKIHGIGPAFARSLNKMGLYTFVQIARWKPEDIDEIAKKLYTAPDRIKRGKWIDEAKKEHYRKYGEQL